MRVFRVGRFGVTAAMVAVAWCVVTGSAAAAETDSPAVEVSAVTTQPTEVVAADDDAQFTAAEPTDNESYRAVTGPVDAPAMPPADDVEEIPLERVWAVRMPGTRPLEVALIDDAGNVVIDGLTDAQNALLSEILASLQTFGLDVRGGFAVNGVDVEVLQAAHDWLVDEIPPSRLTRQRPIALVFFSYQQGMDIHMQHIQQQGLRIEVQYYKVPRGDQEYSAQLAIVPLNTPPAGTLKIILRGQLDPAAIPADAATSDARDRVLVVRMK